MSPPSPPSVALGVPLAVTVSSYAVDFLVKSSSGLFGLATKFEWRQFALTGPTLAIVDTAADKVVHTFNASSVTLRQQAESVYVLESPSLKHSLMVSAPSKTRMRKFQSALAAAASQDPTPPTDVDVLGSLLEVATVMVETEASTAPSFTPSMPFFKSRVGVDSVLAHLAEMQSMYDLQSTCASMEALYVQLLDLEATYCRNPHADNFCHTVHKLHPVQYARYTQARNSTHNPDHSIKSLVSRCPHTDCGYAFRPETMYSLHIKGQTMNCVLCSRRVNRQVLKLAAFIRSVKIFVVECTLRGQGVTLVLEMPPMPSDGKLTSYLGEVRRRIAAIAPQGSRDGVQALQQQVRSTLQAFFSPSNELGSFSKLDLVHAMLRQLDFVNKVCPNMTYWSNPVVLEAAIHRYHKFIHLVRVKQVPGVTLVPTTDIDLVWHTHQCFPADYASFCRKTSHGIFDHDDTIGGGDLQAGYADTFVLWSQTFNEPYSSHPPSYKAWVAKKNVLTNPMFKKTWRKHARVPSHDCRFVGVNESFPIDAILPFATAVEPDAAAVDRAKQPVPDVVHVQVAVIGTPVMDGRVRLQYSRQNYLMEDGGLAAFVYFDASGSCGCGSSATGLSMDAASGCASSTSGGGCGAIGGGCGSSGCASSGGGGGCSSSTTGGCGSSSSGGGGCGTSSSGGGGGCGSSSSGGGCGSSSTS